MNKRNNFYYFINCMVHIWFRMDKVEKQWTNLSGVKIQSRVENERMQNQELAGPINL